MEGARPCSGAFVLVVALLAAAAVGVVGQSPAECATSVAHCTTCRYQFFRGTTTKAICTKCETGYVTRSSGRACYCAPGYYTDGDTSKNGKVGFTCKPCGQGAFCPGAKVTPASSKARTPCGANKMTTTDYATSDLECMVQPGYGWGPGDNSTLCPPGTYNPGYNARKCTPCPGGLTTAVAGAKAPQDCIAGVGQYYLRGKAVACARGTYKSAMANQDCDKCPEGFTTPNDTVSATDKSQCYVLMPGYASPDSPVIGETNATECLPNTYREGEVTVTGSTPAIGCTLCGDGLVTLPNVTRAGSPDACLAAPGYGWAPGPLPVGVATICANGTYNPGYNREKCVSCGDNLWTDTAGKTSSDDCYTAAGWGNERGPDNTTYRAHICPINTYGRAGNTYGLVDVGCVKCPDAAITLSPGSTSESACLAPPGMGWEDGQVLTCEYGWYNEGYNKKPCQYCGDFYNTTAQEWSYEGERGSTSINDCKIDFGYSNGLCPALVPSEGIIPCIRGYYKDTISNTATCQLCPTGTSTSRMLGAVSRMDCNVCRPGFGISSGKIDLNNPRCISCTSGFWSGGYVNDGQPCAKCPQAPKFTGKMVSRDGIFTPEDCYGEYTTDGEDIQNDLWWDLIPMNTSTLILQSELRSSLACQRACSASSECQYFSFYWKGGPDGDGVAKCYHRLAGSTAKINTALVGGNWDTPQVNMVLFEIRERHYVVYPKTEDEVIGVTLQAGVESFLDARFACDANRQCVGLTYDQTSKWRLFTAILREDAIAKYKVIGEDIDSWLETPTGDEQTELWTATCIGALGGGTDLTTSGTGLDTGGSGSGSGGGGDVSPPPGPDTTPSPPPSAQASPSPAPTPDTTPSPPPSAQASPSPAAVAQPSPSPSPVPENTIFGFDLDPSPSPSPAPAPVAASPSPAPATAPVAASPSPVAAADPSPSPVAVASPSPGLVVLASPSPSPEPNNTWWWEYKRVTDGVMPSAEWEYIDCSTMP